MAVISRNGVCYDLRISNYRITVGDLTYVFSSRLHANKFAKRLGENRESINASLSNRFNVGVNVAVLADIVLYTKIETRGFYIVTSDGIELCQKSNITYVGGTVTSPNCNEQ